MLIIVDDVFLSAARKSDIISYFWHSLLSALATIGTRYWRALLLAFATIGMGKVVKVVQVVKVVKVK